jgi:antitoxin HicB
MHLVSPEPTIALKVALCEALQSHYLSPGELGQRLGVDERQAARLIDPKARTPLSKLEEALSALGYAIGIEVRDRRVA